MIKLFLIAFILLQLSCVESTSCGSSYPPLSSSSMMSPTTINPDIEAATNFTVDISGNVESVYAYVLTANPQANPFVGKIWSSVDPSAPICQSSPLSYSGPGWLTLPLSGCSVLPGQTYYASVNYQSTERPYDATFFSNYPPPIISGDLTIDGASYSLTPGSFPSSTFRTSYYFIGVNFVILLSPFLLQ